MSLYIRLRGHWGPTMGPKRSLTRAKLPMPKKTAWTGISEIVAKSTVSIRFRVIFRFIPPHLPTIIQGTNIIICTDLTSSDCCFSRSGHYRTYLQATCGHAEVASKQQIRYPS